MAEFHQRPRVKSYPLPDPGIRHRCKMSVPMCWDWKVTANPSTRLRLPYGAAIPTTMNREPPVPRYQPEIIQFPRGAAHFHSPSPTIPFNQPAPRHPPKLFTCGRKHTVQEEVQIMSLLVGHSFRMSWPCNSRCTAAPFYCLLNTKQAHHLLNSILKKDTAALFFSL